MASNKRADCIAPSQVVAIIGSPGVGACPTTLITMSQPVYVCESPDCVNLRCEVMLWVNNCRASSEVARPLYPQKLPRYSFAVAAVKCQ